MENLKIKLYNAILTIFDECQTEYNCLEDDLFMEKICEAVGMTEPEYKELMLEKDINSKSEKIENKKLKIGLSDGRELIAEVNELDADNTEMVVYVVDDTDKQNIEYQDICLVREGVKNDIECLVWGNTNEEDYTDFFSIGKYEEE